ncbi:MAG: glutaminyl-peptide cyclotransferase [Bacteroidales bacterium]
MRRYTIYFFIFLLVLTAVISCSGSAGAGKEKTTGSAGPAAETDSRPSKRLIEVLAPADNSTLKCTDRIVFSVAQAAGQTKVDSVQLWVGGTPAKTVFTLPATVELEPAGKTGRLSLRAVAYSAATRPQTVALFITSLSDISPVTYRYRVIKSYPHDRRAYTQGLVYDNGIFFESTGQQGESSLRKVEIETGRVLSQVNLDGSLFGEGVALLGDRIYQLTWTTKVGFVYEKETLKQVNRIYYQTQGWGLTTMDDRLVMSDGTNVIWFLDPDFNVLSSVEVWDNKGMVDNLNELEIIDGELWANIWQTDRIARIDPLSGKVLAYVELNNLLPRDSRSQETDVLNGIAWDADKRRLFVTGKYWPLLFEITLTPASLN